MAVVEISKRVKLTIPRIEQFECPAGAHQAFLWDSESPGLAIRATRAGAKSFVFQSRFDGKSIRMTIGKASVWPLNNRMDRVGPGGKLVHIGAREEARRLQSMVDSGRDPRQVKAELKAADVAKRDAANRTEVTFGAAWKEYCEANRETWSERNHVAQLHEILGDRVPKKIGGGFYKPGLLFQFVNERLSALDSERMEIWAEQEAKKHPGTARRSRQHFKCFLSWCKTHKEYKHIAHLEAVDGKSLKAKLGKPKPQESVLQRNQLAAWFAEVRKLSNPVASAYLQYLLLTGPRPMEPSTLRWDQVDFQWKKITSRDKVHGEREFGLTPYVEHLLSSLPRRNEWVFSSPIGPTGKLTTMAYDQRRVCAAAGLPHISPQGLRRSFATLCEWIEMPGGISAQIQGHAPQGVREQKYIRRPIDLLRMWHEKIEKWMLEEAGIEFDPGKPRLHLAATTLDIPTLRQPTARRGR